MYIMSCWSFVVSDKGTDWTLSGNGMHELTILSLKIYCFSPFTAIKIIGTFKSSSFIILSCLPVNKQPPFLSSTLLRTRRIIKFMWTSFYRTCASIGLIWRILVFILLRSVFNPLMLWLQKSWKNRYFSYRFLSKLTTLIVVYMLSISARSFVRGIYNWV